MSSLTLQQVSRGSSWCSAYFIWVSELFVWSFFSALEMSSRSGQGDEWNDLPCWIVSSYILSVLVIYKAAKLTTLSLRFTFEPFGGWCAILHLRRVCRGVRNKHHTTHHLYYCHHPNVCIPTPCPKEHTCDEYPYALLFLCKRLQHIWRRLCGEHTVGIGSQW